MTSMPGTHTTGRMLSNRSPHLCLVTAIGFDAVLAFNLTGGSAELLADLLVHLFLILWYWLMACPLFDLCKRMELPDLFLSPERQALHGSSHHVMVRSLYRLLTP